MIPVRLSLRNFMCYRDNVPPLHFSGIHTASICGNNGNGKSALIDAITWALWGQTRAKSDDELIHSAETEMEVEFDFTISQQLYRIIRRRSRPKRSRSSGQPVLEFQVASNDGFKTISGDTIPQTQQKIIDYLHMDYNTFTNSAFLRQGHADEFTTANPSRRKQVLSNILGLSIYDELESQSKDIARQQEIKKEQLDSGIKDINAELAQQPAYQAEMEQVQSKLSRLEKTIGKQESKLKQLRKQKESMRAREDQLAQLEQHVAERTRTLQQWQQQTTQFTSRIKEDEKIIKQSDSIEEGYTRLVQAKKLNDEFNQKLRLLTRLNDEKHQLELNIERSSQDLLKQHALSQNTVRELEKATQELPRLKTELKQAQHWLQHLTQEEEALKEKRESSQELQSQNSYLESGTALLQKEVAEIEEKLRLLLTQTEAKCPLCETELGERGIRLIQAKYTVDQLKKSESLKSNQATLAGNKTELDTIEEEINRLSTKLNEDKITTQGKINQLTQEITRAEEADSRLDKEKEKLADIEEQLAGKKFANAQQQALDKIEGEIKQLEYDTRKHEEVRQDLTDLVKYEEPKRRLEEALKRIDREKEELSGIEKSIQDISLGLEASKQKKEELAGELNQLPQITDELTRTETEYSSLTAQQKQAQETLGNIKGKLEHCAELDSRKKEREKQLEQAAREEIIYKDLAQAFGKKGIQALLIETALPEIQAETNKLLSRMTDNRMHVKIESQRATKTGTTMETLDINISDELGIRNYEMFSGGEAFRIDFAIRIALSRLLARRAGAPLPTLIIDEGFGTQDTNGIEKLKEAINTIQDDFQKILVITHIEEFRDAFPVRIDVIKAPEGSTLEVS